LVENIPDGGAAANRYFNRVQKIMDENRFVKVFLILDYEDVSANKKMFLRVMPGQKSRLKIIRGALN
jgi:hypothetical protein